MIEESEVFRIGQLTKTHGIKGEISFNFDNDIFDQVDCPYLILKIDEIFVPFFIAEYRFKGRDTALILFEDINNEEKASKLQGLGVWFPRKYHEEDQSGELEFSWDYFIGFNVHDKHIGDLGEVVAVDTQTINTLFMVKNQKEEELIIPANEDFISEIDQEKKIIHLDLPEGLLE